ncbi:hypothetical protein PMNALOAF_2344 [Methylobacterium adhaesivum]|jgi:hypothetical protein|uniref:Uncharacterized protein n=1 Tax=Methylobacterium adhaesivum TaxID=333297 RepID=A0ABT8BE08_9HYPH|nr:hypothetical protein [Methylobacterium adhaesivum]MDN3590236.1 hypothetical protein [Methylobacterium adhaesivum]GJD31091.1 hypothetical protein PMNALOAF_2344 [Methylobacterium adhaesivum]
MMVPSDSLLPAITALGIPLGTPETARPSLVIAPPGTGQARFLDGIGRASKAWIVVNTSSVAGRPAADSP